MIAIIDYGLGNLKSVAGAIEKTGYKPIITSKQSEIDNSEKIILPGVGAFSEGIKNLKKFELFTVLSNNVLKQKKPILGICLGAQLLAKISYEFGQHEGLGYIEASVDKLETNDQKLRIPHVGWNELFQKQKSILFEDISDNSLFYFVHSYILNCYNKEIVIGESKYGKQFTAAFQQDNIYGTQFHPEKSQLEGIRLLKNFLDYA